MQENEIRLSRLFCVVARFFVFNLYYAMKFAEKPSEMAVHAFFISNAFFQLSLSVA